MPYVSRLGEPIQRILATYPNQARQVQALEILYRTALSQVEVDNEAALASKRCRGLHLDKPGRSVACGKCLDAVLAGGARGERVAAESGESVPDRVQAEVEEDEALAKSLLGGK